MSSHSSSQETDKSEFSRSPEPGAFDVAAAVVALAHDHLTREVRDGWRSGTLKKVAIVGGFLLTTALGVGLAGQENIAETQTPPPPTVEAPTTTTVRQLTPAERDCRDIIPQQLIQEDPGSIMQWMEVCTSEWPMSVQNLGATATSQPQN